MNATSTHQLQVNVMRTERLVGPIPSNFYVHSVDVVPQTMRRAGSLEKTSAEIHEKGGLGLAEVHFNFSNGATAMVRIGRYEITEPLSASPPVPGWQDLVTEVANGDVQPADVFDLLEYYSPSDEQNNGAVSSLQAAMTEMHL